MKEGTCSQRHLPEGLGEREFYRPTSEGEEARMRDFLQRMRALRRGAPGDSQSLSTGQDYAPVADTKDATSHLCASAA